MAATVLQRGGNITLPADNTEIRVALGWTPRNQADMEVDASAFVLAAGDKVRGDEDMVFYNNPRTRDGAVETTENAAGTGAAQTFALHLSAIPVEVRKIAFTVTIDEGQTRGQNFGLLDSAWASVSMASDHSEIARFELSLAGTPETAMIFCEVYRHRDNWKFKAVAQGYVGGLAPLATEYGIDVANESASAEPAVQPPPAPPAPPPPAAAPPAAAPAAAAPAANERSVRLEKRVINLQKKDPKLVSLIKSANVQLEKRGLSGHEAKVALCLDISGSMHRLYQKGSIDELVRRVLALGFLFDDDGEIDVFLFGSKAYHFGAVGTDSYKTFVKDMLRRHRLEGGTAYGKVMQLIREHYRGDPAFGRIPVYVMFVTDGDTHDHEVTEQQIQEASREGIFWQFLAIGEPPEQKRGFFKKLLSSDFTFLSYLDTMEGRFVDNANFFLLRDPAEPSDEELYELMMAEYPGWLEMARAKGILG